MEFFINLIKVYKETMHKAGAGNDRPHALSEFLKQNNKIIENKNTFEVSLK